MVFTRSVFALFFFCIHSFILLHATDPTPLYLKNRFAKAQEGDYLVAYISKSYTLLHIHTNNSKELIIEEITVPKHCIEKMNNGIFNWKEWVQKGAPGSSGWVMYSLNPQTGAMLNFYNFTHRAWTKGEEASCFISQLLSLQFIPTRAEDRKKVGPAPLAGNLDRRPFWSPPARFEGIPITDTTFSAWHATWPQDGSEMAGKTIEAYLPDSGPYPNYFPYWIEIRGQIARVSVRVKDTGSGLRSPKPRFPKPNTT